MPFIYLNMVSEGVGESKNERVTYNDPGHAHELTFSVYRRKKLMLENGVVEAFLASLLTASNEMEFDIWAYVVMPDHVHLLLYPRNEVYDMSRIRTKIKKPVTEAVFKLYPDWRSWMQSKRSKEGPHFWQRGPGYDRNMFTPAIIRAAIAFIHDNPVRKGFVDSALDWAWSSARNYAGFPGEIPVVLFDGPL